MTVEFKYDFSEVLQRLQQLNQKLQNMSEPMKDIGEYLVYDTQRRFDEGRSPNGTPWAPLQVSHIAAHLAIKKSLSNKAGREAASARKTLVKTQRLRDSIYPDAGRDYVRIGTSAPYAAIHQFGGKTSPHIIRPKRKQALAWPGGIAKRVNHPGSRIPARPFMGVSNENQSEILQIINSYLMKFE